MFRPGVTAGQLDQRVYTARSTAARQHSNAKQSHERQHSGPRIVTRRPAQRSARLGRDCTVGQLFRPLSRHVPSGRPANTATHDHIQLPAAAQGWCCSVQPWYSLFETVRQHSHRRRRLRRTFWRGSPSRSRHPRTTAHRSSSLWTTWHSSAVWWSTPCQAAPPSPGASIPANWSRVGSTSVRVGVLSCARQ